MPSTRSLGLLSALSILSQTIASPLASGHRAASGILPSPTYIYPNGSSGYSSTQRRPAAVTVGAQQTITAISNPTSSLIAPPVHSAAPLPIESFTPGPVLAPAVPLNHPVDDPIQLHPTQGDTLYYTDTPPDPSIEHTFALLNTTSRYKSVVLGHSSLVKSVSCADDGILVTFTNATGFQYAANTWPDAGEDFVLVTASEGCGNSTDQRTFWLIDSLSYRNGSNAIDAKVAKELAYEDAFDEIHIVWGKFKPASNKTMAKRGFADDLKHKFHSVATAAEGKVSSVASAIESKASHAKQDWDGFTAALTAPSLTGQFDVPLAAKTDDPSPWGGAKLIFEDKSKVSSIGKNKSLSAPIATDFQLFCVDCSLDSHFTLLGQAAVTFNPEPQVTKLTAELDGTIIANLNLGLVATAEFKDTRSTNIWTYPVPDMGITVKDIITAGLTVNMDAAATLDITAEGDLLAGVKMTIPDFKATVDFLDEDSGAGNSLEANPVWEQRFNASGALGAKVTLGLPISLNLGVEIPKIHWNKSIALTEQPSISAQAGVSGSTDGSHAEAQLCWSIDAHNDVSLNVLNLKTFNLNHHDWPLESGCQPLELPGSEGTSTSVTASPASTVTSIASTLPPTATGTGNPTTTSVDLAALLSSVAGGVQRAGGTGSLGLLPPVGTGVSGVSVNSTVVQGTGVAAQVTGYTGSTGVPYYRSVLRQRE